MKKLPPLSAAQFGSSRPRSLTRLWLSSCLITLIIIPCVLALLQLLPGNFQTTSETFQAEPKTDLAAVGTSAPSLIQNNETDYLSVSPTETTGTKPAAPLLSAAPTLMPIPSPTPTPTPSPTPTPAPSPTPTPAPSPTPSPTPVSEATPQAESIRPYLVGYFAGWKTAEGYDPAQIDASRLTHLNYAFAKIDSSLKITMGYPKIDPQNFAFLRKLKKKYPALRTLISVGGWDWSTRFSDVAASRQSREQFAASCVDFIVEHGFDGIDIDWEYPVQGGASGTIHRPEDRENFTRLIKTLREYLNAQGQKDNRTYLLTFAGGCYTTYIKNTDLAALAQTVDFANLMTYDLHGLWDARTDFNAPLYAPDRSSAEQINWSVDKTVRLWLDAGMPAAKMVLGIPFYGCKYTGVTSASDHGWYQTYGDGWLLTYQDIARKYLNNPAFKRYFHNQAKTPWLFDGQTFISYEDPESIAWKVQYIRDQNLGGAMFWQITQDNGTLLQALKKEISK